MSKLTALLATLVTFLVLAPAAGAASLAYIGRENTSGRTGPPARGEHQGCLTPSWKRWD